MIESAKRYHWELESYFIVINRKFKYEDIKKKLLVYVNVSMYVWKYVYLYLNVNVCI